MWLGAMEYKMNENSVKKIKKTIKEILLNPQINESYPYVEYKTDLFEIIAKELNNRKIDYKIDYSLCLVIFEKMERNLDKVNILSNDARLSEFVDSVFNIYANTPFLYDVDFHFYKLRKFPVLHENSSVSLKQGKISTSLFFDDEFENYAIVRVKAKGVYTGSYPNSFMKGVMQSLNILIFILILNDVITFDYMDKYLPSILSSVQGIDENKITIDVVNHEFPNFSTHSKLSGVIENYYSKLIFDSGEVSALAVYNAFYIANEIINDNDKEILRIKSAIDWYIHSNITEDETMAFIQACMGLESIFGDDDSEGGLTAILSDRCAYLIGKNIKDRREIKKTFREIYKIRSKIIHGVRSFLNENEKIMLFMARQYLRESILKELGNLGLLTQSQQR